jgi:trans-aconitate 2-methyltransferase
MPRDWDGKAYHEVSAPMEAMGLEVLDRLELEGGETVLDAGCGTGRVTRALLERLPRGRVIAVDAAPSMVEVAARELPAADVRLADLAELDLGEQVDAILSTATFHWVPDHDRLFERLAAALRPGGRLEAQCGGAGNIASFKGLMRDVAGSPPFAAHFAGWRDPWYFATPEETERRLAARGFDEIRCWLERRAVELDEPRGFVTTIQLGPFHAQLPSELHEPFTEAVLERAGAPLTLDYVRLNISARRAP